jgi:hypothetical protein
LESPTLGHPRDCWLNRALHYYSTSSSSTSKIRYALRGISGSWPR